jgi:hypothetical protein
MNAFRNTEQYLQKLRLVFYATVLVPILLFMIVYFMQKDGKIIPSSPELGEGMIAVFIQVFCLILCGVAYWIYQQKLKPLRNSLTLRVKLERLFNASILKFALLESANLITAIFFWLSGHPLFMIVFAATLVLFLMSNPSVYSIMNDLKVNAEEKDIIKQNKEIE